MKREIIAAVRTESALSEACQSNVKTVFELVPSIASIDNSVQLCRRSGKRMFVHIDLAEGIGKDRAGLQFLSDIGVDGVISTRTGMIKTAKEVGLKTVQRIFILDEQSIQSAKANLKTRPDMVEIMPGVIPRAIREICAAVELTVIAGGLIQEEADVVAALQAGAAAVSTSKMPLWYL